MLYSIQISEFLHDSTIFFVNLLKFLFVFFGNAFGPFKKVPSLRNFADTYRLYKIVSICSSVMIVPLEDRTCTPFFTSRDAKPISCVTARSLASHACKYESLLHLEQNQRTSMFLRQSLFGGRKMPQSKWEHEIPDRLAQFPP